MHIHIKRNDECIRDIAKEYGVPEENLRQINEIYEGDAAEGEELLILTPTRSYTVQPNDSLERIALRFGVLKKDILAQNPWLCDKALRVGDRIAVKYGERTGGMAVANGYFYKGCSEDALRRALPFLTYITFGSAVADKEKIARSFDDSREVRLANNEKKIPLVRVYDKYTERYKSGENLTAFAEGLIELAKSGGYKGIVMDACALSNSAEEFTAFLMILRKLMIGSDLILITEINDKSPIEFSEYADGSVIYYPKYAEENPANFEDGERRAMADFACLGESAKVFIDLPAPVIYDGRYTTYGEAMAAARRNGYKVEHNESTLLSHFSDRKQGECVFTSLNGIKALLDLTREFDYMGVCFDIMRTPLSHLMMYSSMFKTSYFNSVRTREGCSRGVED